MNKQETKSCESKGVEIRQSANLNSGPMPEASQFEAGPVAL